MTTTTIANASGVDSYDWVDSVGAHPETTSLDSAVALYLIDCPVALSEEEFDKGFDDLVRLGFLRPVLVFDRDIEPKFKFVIPEKVS